jgi:hypothetical protein
MQFRGEQSLLYSEHFFQIGELIYCRHYCYSFPEKLIISIFHIDKPV